MSEASPQGVTTNVTVAPVTENVTEPSDASGGVLAGLQDMPEPQKHAIDAATADDTARAKTVESAASGKVDIHGRAFDPLLHEVEADGTPRLTRTGMLSRKRGQGAASRKAAAESRIGPAPAPGAGPADPPPIADKRFDPVEIDNCAKTATGLFFMIGVVVFGEDGKPIVDVKDHVDEPEEVYGAFLTYYRIKGAKELPPSLVLLVALGGYGRRRLAMPTVRNRLAGWKEKIGIWWWKLRNRKRAPVRSAEMTNDAPERAADDKSEAA